MQLRIRSGSNPVADQYQNLSMDDVQVVRVEGPLGLTGGGAGTRRWTHGGSSWP